MLLEDRRRTGNLALKEQTVHGGETGGLLGGVLGWLAGVSALAIPGIGPFIAVGPIVAALGGAAVGTVLGGLTGGSGGFAGLGIPTEVEQRVHQQLMTGQILIGVHYEDVSYRHTAETIFRSEGAEELSIPGERAA